MTRLALIACMLQACGGGRDVEGGPVAPPASASAASTPDAGAPDAGGVYERMVTREHATFGLAEARGIEPERLGQTLDAIANGFERCAVQAQQGGWLEKAALRLVVEIDAHGQVVGVDAKLDDPAHGGKVALLCLVAPVKALNFGEGTGTARRGLALEVLFGPVRID